MRDNMPRDEEALRKRNDHGRLHIYIPTYRRAYLQRTLDGLPTSVMWRTTLVCDKHDAPLLKKYTKRGCGILVVPKEVTSIAKKRAWILENTPFERILMLDDDLHFCYREYDRKGKFWLPRCTRKQFREAIDKIEKLLKRYAHVGISPRQGNNNIKDRGTINTSRCIYALGYHVPTLLRRCELGRIEHREDMDYTLQLFKAGYDNAVLVDFCCQQAYNNKGGASEQRTVAKSDKDAKKLAKLHHPFVRVDLRLYKGSQQRKEVTVQWKKAYAAARKKRKLRAT